MRIREKQKEELLQVVKGVLPGAEWAPEEAWITDGLSEENSRAPSEPLHFREGELTLFLKAELRGQHFNSIGRVEHAVEKWAKANLPHSGKLTIDVRLFRVGEDRDKTEVEVEEEMDLSF